MTTNPCDPCWLCPSIAGGSIFAVSKSRKGGSPVSLGSYGTSVDGNFVLDLF